MNYIPTLLNSGTGSKRGLYHSNIRCILPLKLDYYLRVTMCCNISPFFPRYQEEKLDGFSVCIAQSIPFENQNQAQKNVSVYILRFESNKYRND